MLVFVCVPARSFQALGIRAVADAVLAFFETLPSEPVAPSQQTMPAPHAYLQPGVTQFPAALPTVQHPPGPGGAPGSYGTPGPGWAAQYAPAPYASGPVSGPAPPPHATYNPLMVYAGPPSVPAVPHSPPGTFAPAPGPPAPVGVPGGPLAPVPLAGTGSSGAAPTSWFGPAAYASMCAMVATGHRAAIMTGLQVSPSGGGHWGWTTRQAQM
jgi:hypothetical protein